MLQHNAPTPATLARFDELQRKLVALWHDIGRTVPSGEQEDPNTVVVVPSLTVDKELTEAMQQAYEERFLFIVFLLQQPHIRMIYVTSEPINESIISYYMDLIAPLTPDNPRERLFLVSPNDGGHRSLSQKLLDSPETIAAIRALVPDHDRAHLVPFITTNLERELTVRLDLPMYAADPKFLAYGTKSGSRRVFREEGVPHPAGAEDLHSVDAVVRAIAKLRASSPTLEKVVIKLNEGVSGDGNAIVALRGLPAPGDATEATAIIARLDILHFAEDDMDHDLYFTKLAEHGGVVEAFVSGMQAHSPSAQLRISPIGEVELLSTHDQMLGGPDGQSYLGCIFPANPEYGPLIMREAEKIGRRFAREGIIGRFALDFMAVRGDHGQWEAYAIEVNLRKGGTTHPFLTLQYLTEGQYNPETGHFATERGAERCYVATDHVEAEAYQVFTPKSLIELVQRHGLHYDHGRQTGVVLHMISSIGTVGRTGVTAIAETPAAADTLYQQFLATLDAEAARLAQVD